MEIFVLKDEKRIPELIELFRLGLGETTTEYWKWRLFMDFGGDPAEAIVTQNEQGQLVGMMSVLPTRYGKKGELKGVNLCDWVVQPEYRGQGLIGKMYHFMTERYQNLGYDFMFAFPNEMSYPILKKYGFESHMGIESWNTGIHFNLYKKKIGKCIKNGISYQVTKTCPFTEQIQQSEDRNYRSLEFFKWKYDLNPETDYQWLSAWRDGQLLAYFVFTITKGRIHMAVNVYDWEVWYDDMDLLREASKVLKSYGDYVSIWGLYNDKKEMY